MNARCFSEHAYSFDMATVTNIDNLVTFFDKPDNFKVHLGHERTGRINEVELAHLRYFIM